MELTDHVKLVYLAILVREELERALRDFLLDLRDMPQEREGRRGGDGGRHGRRRCDRWQRDVSYVSVVCGEEYGEGAKQGCLQSESEGGQGRA